MRGPGIVILVYGLLGLGGGIISYSTSGSTEGSYRRRSLWDGSFCERCRGAQRQKYGFLMAPILTAFLTMFFGYRFIDTGEFILSGLMAVLGMVAVLLYFALES